MNNTYARVLAIQKKNRERWLKLCPRLTNESGIYILTREDENGFKFAYIGQAKHILDRLVQHLSGYQHIDLSLKKHGLYDPIKNIYGWQVQQIGYPIEKLDEMERYWTLVFSKNGYQLRNKTSGGQDSGKSGIAENKPSKGYHDGLKQGYENCRKEIIEMFSKYLDFSIKDTCRKKDGSISEIGKKKESEFKEFINDRARD